MSSIADKQASLSTPTPASVNLYELDVFRGMAAIFMVVNHATIRLLPADLVKEGLWSSVFFVSSFAPVFFFFITGFGYGLQGREATRSNRYWHNILYKIALLLIADQFLFWRGGSSLGMDFLGFIGLSMLTIAVIRKTPKPWLAATILIALSIGLRFLLGGKLTGLFGDHNFLLWLIGAASLPNVSYAFSPWITYPCLGYIFGEIVALHLQSQAQSQLEARTTFAFIGSFLVLGPLSYLSWVKQLSFFRWGTMGIGFYILSLLFLVLAGFILYVVRVNGWGNRIRRVMGLRGISSLAVVPIHYMIISLTLSVTQGNLRPGLFIPMAILITYCSLSWARQIENLAQFLKGLKMSNVMITSMGGGLVLLLTGLMVPFSHQAILPNLIATLAQLVICLMLVVRWKS